MLKVILNRLKPQAEEIISEEKLSLEPEEAPQKRSSTLEFCVKRNLQHWQNLYYVIIDFKKAFDREWHAVLWATMRKHSIIANLVRTVEQL